MLPPAWPRVKGGKLQLKADSPVEFPPKALSFAIFNLQTN